MNVNKGLKTKNKLAKDIQNKWSIIQLHNSNRTDVEKKSYDVKAMYQELLADVDAMVDVKAKVAKANVGVYELIFRLAELKGIVLNLKSIVVKEGPQAQFVAYGQEPKEIEWAAQMDHAFLDAEIAKFEKEIEEIQDQLDKYNFNTDI